MRVLTGLAISLCLFAAVALTPRHSHAVGIGDALGLSPHWDWKTFETEHFRVTFPSELREPAVKSAQYLEEAHAFLSRQLYWTPLTRTQVLVIDNTDSANGLTSAVGRFGMVFMVTPPESYYSTYYYDDWLRLLAIHEYTHFLNMDATTDFFRILRYAFGDLFLPNALWPSWMLEGLAVYNETRFTEAGRGRSPYYSMVVRAAVDEGVLDTTEFITLDKVNGPNPYHPGGETPYLFGYDLMNELARTAKPGPTRDEVNDLESGEDALGVMSYRSSRRVPYFINSNLENILGKDWYDLWNAWVRSSRARATREIQRIESQPVTEFRWQTTDASLTLGSAISSDGQWIAYTQASPDERMQLFARNLRTGETRSLFEKTSGSAIAFIPGTHRILFDMMRRQSTYRYFSDLGLYDLDTGELAWLTDGLRAQSPAVSPDGKRIAFGLTRDQTVSLVMASLVREKDATRLGPMEILYAPEKYGRVGHARFSPDGRRVVFSVHENGRNSEELLEVDLATRKEKLLFGDGHYNRFPSFGPKGELYFISDATGIENLYRLTSDGQPPLTTNAVTGIRYPEFDPTTGALYVSAYRYKGWNLARIELPKTIALSQDAATLEAPPAPPADGDSRSSSREVNPEIHDYSIWPSILPRQWAPLLVLQSHGVYVGGEVLGFDALDEHSYFASAAYDSFVQTADWTVAYSNRMLGPSLSFSAENTTTNIQTSTSDDTLLGFTRRKRFTASIFYPFIRTFSTLVPELSARWERSAFHIPGASPAYDDVVSENRYLPYLDANLYFTSGRESPLGISRELGRTSRIGVRSYFHEDPGSWKLIASDTEYFRLVDHFVLVPSIAASYSSRFNSSYFPTNVVLQGRQSRLVNSFEPDNLDQLTIRGYPFQAFATRGAAVGSLDFRAPLDRIFRGWGTHPVFLENLMSFAFVQAAYLPAGEPGFKSLSSAGGGIQLSSVLLNYIPLTYSLEYHHGFRSEAGGKGEFFFQITGQLAL